MRKNISLIVLLAAIILKAATIPLMSNAAGTVSLPQTGQTASYATGDDGDLRVGWGAGLLHDLQ